MAESNDLRPILKIEHLSKNFSGTLALNDVSFNVYPGEIHALLGENGAGKSTLIKILDEIYTCTDGTFELKGKPFSFKDGHLPISVIHQDLGIMEDLSVAENIAAVAGYSKKHGLISWEETRNTAKAILKRMDCEIDVDSLAGELPSAERSMVAISRALAVKSDILILDEPTATLTQTDVEKLFAVLQIIKQEGIGIVYVSHRLDEVFQLADRVTVLRNGENVATKMVSDVTRAQLIHDIIGREEEEIFVTAVDTQETEKLLEVEHLTYNFVRDISFDLHKGEILTLFGLRGAGHHEVGRILYGYLKPDRMDAYRINGKKARISAPEAALQAGVSFLSSKRLEESLASLFTVRENIYINPVANGAKLFRLMKLRREARRAKDTVERFTVKPRNAEALIGTLSGGNQQKVVLARLFETNPSIYLLEEPTIGVDIGAKADIYKKINEAIAEGKGVILISSDYEEVKRISHRVLVFSKGRIRAELNRDQITNENLTHYATC